MRAVGEVRLRLPGRREAAAWAYAAAGAAVMVVYLVTSSAVRYLLPVVISASVVFAKWL